jgi:hypothetical protein
MRYAVTGAIAAVALVSAMSVAVAQDRGKDGRGNAGPAHSAPSARAAPRSAPAVRSHVEHAQPRARVERQVRQHRAESRPERSVRQKRVEGRHEAPKNVQRAQREERSRRAAQEHQRTEQKRQAERKERTKTTQGQANARNGQEAAKQNVKRVEATPEQRVRVRDRLIKEHRADRNRDRIRGVRPIIGTRIPRRHHLHRLPVWIVDYAPIYRSYSYVWIDDDICIVDPATYVIVDVLPASSQRAELPELNLTSAQMRFVYAEVPKDAPVDLHIRLALGAEIPRDVALYTFPDHVLARIPKLTGYRYVVAGKDVAIVDPADYAVVLVITPSDL